MHIVTPELWKVRKPTIFSINEQSPECRLSPVFFLLSFPSRETYIQNGVNWYKLFGDYVDGITFVSDSEALSNILSVTQFGKQNSESSARSQLPDLVDPYAPGCSIHPRERSSCAFGPCSHVACSKCLGSAMLAGSKCPKCRAGIDKFIGMLTPT